MEAVDEVSVMVVAVDPVVFVMRASVKTVAMDTVLSVDKESVDTTDFVTSVD